MTEYRRAGAANTAARVSHHGLAGTSDWCDPCRDHGTARFNAVRNHPATPAKAADR